jgi:hypothetical protein
VAEDTSTIHIQTVLMRDDEHPKVCAVRIMVWPLPDEDALHVALEKVARAALHAELIKHGLASEGSTDLSAKGPVQ